MTTLVAAESNFDPRARNGDARGLLQLWFFVKSRGSTREVLKRGYEA